MPNFNENMDVHLIPDKTVVLVRMGIKPGGGGEDGALTLSKKGDSKLLYCSFTPVGGEYASHKIFDQWIVDGAPETVGTFIARSYRLLKSILNSAHNLEPTDTSAEAQAKRNVGYPVFDGLVFYARIGIRPEEALYEAKNIVTGAVVKGQPDWPGPIDPSMQPSPNGSGSSPRGGGAATQASAPIARPSWASPGPSSGAK
jgi:hypothetical protein